MFYLVTILVGSGRYGLTIDNEVSTIVNRDLKKPPPCPFFFLSDRQPEVFEVLESNGHNLWSCITKHTIVCIIFPA